ncbi:MAG: hypothetical protein A3I44_03670 [Candidatus Sungbacteria bacterium RIFCSPLOWO2_02_FULL_51_17]|nr:MAG: hypothetical protein A3I44_03670 [Candidatus Sungbacteria bacterium RIFCSPLOWO2_02_FULL_51_17]
MITAHGFLWEAAWSRIERIGERRYGVTLYVSILFLAIMSPLLFFGRMVFDQDLLYQFYPYFYFFRGALESGESFLWMPAAFFGFPSFVSHANSILSPVSWVFVRLVPAPENYHWLVFFYVVLGVLAADAFLRTLGISFWGRFLGCIAYATSAFLFNLDISTHAALFLLPFLCTLVMALERGTMRPWWCVLIGGLGTALAFSSAFYGFFVQAFFVAGLFALYRAWASDNSRMRMRIIFGFALLAVFGVALSFPQLYWAGVFSGLSDRAGGLSYERAATLPMMLGDALRLWFPYFRLNVIANAEASFSYGFLPLFFLCVSLFRRREDGIRRFFFWLFALSLLASIQYSPLFWILQKIPVLNYFRGPSRWMFVGAFGATVLIASAVDQYARSGHGEGTMLYRRFSRLSTLFLGVAVAGSLVLTVFGAEVMAILKRLFFAYYYPHTSQALESAQYEWLVEKYFHDIGRTVDLFSPGVIASFGAIAAGLLLIRSFRRGRMSAVAFVRGAGVVTAVSMALILFFFYPLFSKERIGERTPVIAYLETHPGTALSFLSRRSESEFSSDPGGIPVEAKVRSAIASLSPNTGIYFGIRTVGYNDNLLSARARRVQNMFEALEGMAGATADEKIAEFKKHKPFLDILGIRYIISSYDIGYPFVAVASAPHPVEYGYSAYLFRNPDARPYAYAAGFVEIVGGGGDEIFSRMTKSVPDATVFLECGECPQGHMDATTVDVLQKQNGRLMLSSSVKGAGVLVVSEFAVPGWRATINGTAVPIYVANGVFMSVVVPEGTSTIEFQYEPFTIANLL